MHYSYQDLVDTYRALGLKQGDTISLKTGLRSLGFMSANGEDTLECHLNAIDKVINLDRGTVVVASTSTNLCNTDIPFSMQETPGIMGALTEHIRTKRNAIRSFHGFESYSALGAGAADIFNGLNRHAYGPDTPEARMVALNAKCVSVGLPSTVTCSIVHHVEMVAAVPYRYIKEYNHPVKQDDGSINKEVFYRHPWYLDSDIKKSYARFFEHVYKLGFSVDTASIGGSQIESYSLKNFFDRAIKVLHQNIYAVLAHEPRIKPWKN